MKKTKKVITNPICGICNTLIHTNVDSYVQVKDFRDGKYIGEGFYHNKCFNDRLNNKKAQQSQELLDRVNKLLDRVGVEKPSEEFVIS